MERKGDEEAEEEEEEEEEECHRLAENLARMLTCRGTPMYHSRSACLRREIRFQRGAHT